MRLLAVVGSPRKGGNTDILIEHVIKGAREAGAETEKIYLNDLDLRFCQGCELCISRKPWKGCVQRDDMSKVHEAILRSDALVVGTPIYFFGPSAQTKLFLDRWMALLESGAGGGRHALKGKKMGVVVAYGDTEPVAAGAVNAFGTFRDAAKYLRIDLVGIVHGSAPSKGDIAKNATVLAEAVEMGRKLAR